ncbi:hypothetical protein PR202_gb29302 [Eleusine coracana subsp. coracana]|uniref:RNA helicase n=1 Tax=Eleusine coracana subsp. coracana TaxID=191504 RepID=A0AAV5FZN3_ELECO|nr:hypothetical protein PR202_gb29302 [Eleusine coracana subsp. coracana]
MAKCEGCGGGGARSRTEEHGSAAEEVELGRGRMWLRRRWSGARAEGVLEPAGGCGGDRTRARAGVDAAANAGGVEIGRKARSGRRADAAATEMELGWTARRSGRRGDAVAAGVDLGHRQGTSSTQAGEVLQVFGRGGEDDDAGGVAMGCGRDDAFVVLRANIVAVYSLTADPLMLVMPVTQSPTPRSWQQRRLFVHKQRQKNLSVCKQIVKKRKKRPEDCPNYIGFSDEAKHVLHELFTHYPPDIAELNGNAVRDSSAKVANFRWRDSAFCRPAMRKTDIAKEVEMFTCKMNESPQLRKVIYSGYDCVILFFALIVENKSKLPISSFKQVIYSTLENHQVVLISGETGCGKTTQVPQYILDHMWGKGESCKIICSQPRRISAISVAERISIERGESVGRTVGYKIRLESKGGKNSSIMFCTNGILLRLLIGRGTNTTSNKQYSKHLGDDAIMEITHIIVDEIHERDKFSDFMLTILRDLLPLYPHLRLVLMSATLDAERFSKYFNGCPVIQVPGFTYPVKTFYLEDVLSILHTAGDSHLNFTNSYLKQKCTLTDDLKSSLDESIELALVNDEFDPLLQLISAEQSLEIYNYSHTETGVTPLMVFATKGQLGDVCMLLSLGVDCSARDCNGKSALDWAQQEKRQEVCEVIRKHMELSSAKSTENSELLHKYMETIDPELIDTMLIERLIGKICVDSTEGGRPDISSWLGRYKENKGKLFLDPISIVQVKLLDSNSRIADFLNRTLDPPIEETIRTGISVLQDLGALTQDEELTELGEKLGSLPVHPRTAKMLLFALLMNCLDPALTLACATGYRDPFLLPMTPDERKRADTAKVELASLYGGFCDQLAVVAAFDCWRCAKARGQQSKFCSKYFVSSSIMNMISNMRKQLQKEMFQSGFVPEDTSACSLNSKDPGIMRAVLMAGAYPTVGKLLPPKNNKMAVVEIASGDKVRIHPQSCNFKISFSKSSGNPLVIYDEITRGDYGMYIKKCSIVGVYPLLLLATEMVVAPPDDNDEVEDSSEEDIMSSSDNIVSVVVDRWIRFDAMALDVAQIYCLRERLASAILYKVRSAKNPKAVLPCALGASMHAIACTLSYDALPAMVRPDVIPSYQASNQNSAEASSLLLGRAVGYTPPGSFLMSLFEDGSHNATPQKSSGVPPGIIHSKDSIMHC